METLKMNSKLCNNLFINWQLHRCSRNSLSLWILNVHYHIQKPLSLGLKLNQVNIHFNIITPAMLTTLN